MTRIASILKSEISRVARKAVRFDTQGLKKAVATYRTDIATLKRRTAALETELRRVQRAQAKAAPAQDEPEPAAQIRFSAKGLLSQRQRLNLTVHECGLLLGASGQSIYNWEGGKAKPQARHLAAIAALRGMGRKEATARLVTLQSTAR